ncbi:CPBP family intramembrane metalloprotease domain-containing protein [Enemella evansiae]|uniref:CPBP family intramembrane metalloprotease domain-containing protein n=1 Tax=Enemella evansiae TaxID=2016499 RepID=A0A255FYL5_9ACTN|nr:CPBP family intramembrane glutamic endopeptidase [Enemella evansiae]OYO08777.1 CPBP family intramembrane metalloprotease domain-containing protein [Enemella evansiae]
MTAQPAYPVFQPPPQPVTLPVEESEYHQFYRTPAFAFWRPIVALLVGAGLWFVATLLGSIPLILDLAQGRVDLAELSAGRILMTPWVLLGTNLSLAALIPIAIACQVWFFRQRPRWLHSVQGRFRWRWLLLGLVPVIPLWLGTIVVQGLALGGAATAGGAQTGGPSRQWLIYLVVITLTTPLQCAGEEYGFRGMVNRSVASFFRNRRVGLVAGAVVSSGVFASLHGSSDIWANAFYFGFGMVACLLVWRTGGLEAAIAMHSVNNLISFYAAVLTGEIDRPMQMSNVAGGPEMLLPVLAGIVAVLILNSWRARRGVPIATAPGREQIAGLPSMPPPPPAGPNPPAYPPPTS